MAPRSRAAISPDADSDAVKATFTDWVRAAEAADAQRYGRFITEDFVFLGPGGLPVEGRESVVQWLGTWFADWQFSFPAWTDADVMVGGDLAIHRYSGVATLTPRAGGAPTHADRKYMDVMRREANGQWRVARHMFNLNS